MNLPTPNQALPPDPPQFALLRKTLAAVSPNYAPADVMAVIEAARDVLKGWDTQRFMIGQQLAQMHPGGHYETGPGGALAYRGRKPDYPSQQQGDPQ